MTDKPKVTQETQDRTLSIGGSDASAVLGLNRWRSVLGVWCEKTGQVVPEDISGKLPVRFGIKAEEIVAEFFCEQTGKKVRRKRETVFHKEYPFLSANLDRIVEGEDAILECKTASARKADEWADGATPIEYEIQCNHYLAVTGKKKCYLAVMIGNEDFQIREFVRDEVVLSELVRKEVSFWNTFVVPKVMPAQVSCADSEILLSLYPQAKAPAIDLAPEMDAILERIEAMKEDKKSLDGQIKQAENEVKLKLGDAEVGKTSRYRVSWKNQVSKRVDGDKLGHDFPEIYKQVLKESETRVLRVSENKEGK